MLPDCQSARISSVCATRIITTPGAKSSTRPFMCTMPTHRAVDRGVRGWWKWWSSGGFASISAAEYFVDTDPGAGSGIAFQAKDGAFDSEVESILPKDLNVTGLSVGPHLVGVRYKDNNNTWGEVLYQTIHVYDANPEVNAGGSGGSGGIGRIYCDCGGGIFYRQ